MKHMRSGVVVGLGVALLLWPNIHAAHAAETAPKSTSDDLDVIGIVQEIK